MNVSRKALCITYGIFAAIALIFTWGNVLGFLAELGFWGGTVQFWQDVLVNESSRFITADMLFFMLAVFFWMILEARRRKLPFVWAYIACSFFIGPSIVFPLFMIHRELRPSEDKYESGDGALKPRDLAGLAVCGLAFMVYTGIALTY